MGINIFNVAIVFPCRTEFISWNDVKEMNIDFFKKNFRTPGNVWLGWFAMWWKRGRGQTKYIVNGLRDLVHSSMLTDKSQPQLMAET